MKHITRKQARVIAKHINNLYKNHFAWWDIEPLTIEETANTLYRDNEKVYAQITQIALNCFVTEDHETENECEKILDMIRCPEFINEIFETH